MGVTRNEIVNGAASDETGIKNLELTGERVAKHVKGHGLNTIT